MFRIALPFAAAFALSLSACHSTPSPDAAAAPSTETSTPAAEPTPTPVTDAAKRCDATHAQWAVGKAADQATVDKLVADSGSSSARVIKPGQAVTMDFREDRLNVEVDAANVVTGVRCG